jgi:acetyltransferase-like isoleucine patch superfamily enzyme
MAYYTKEELKKLNFKFVGNNVKISDKASIYNHENIEVGDNSRVDDFCMVSGRIIIGKNVHITPGCLIAGGEKGIFFEDFTTVAYGVQIFTQSDDYSGQTMTNSTIPKKYKNEYKKEIVIAKYSIIGARSIIMPGVTLAEGTSVGAMTLVLNSTKPWGIYVGCPAKRVKDRSKDMLKKVEQYIEGSSSDTI